MRRLLIARIQAKQSHAGQSVAAMPDFVRSAESLTMKRLHDIFQPWVAQTGWEKDNDGFYRVLAQLVAESPDPITPQVIKVGIRMAYETSHGAMHYSGGALYHFEDRGGVILSFVCAE
jgi:hypothetical protein